MNMPTNNEQYEREQARWEAARWFARLRASARTPSMDSEFRRWYEASPHNALAYEQCKMIWLMADGLQEDEDLRGELESARVTAANRRAGNRINRRIPGLWHGIRVAAMLLAVAGSVLLISRFPANQYSTGVGGQKVVHLPDGSTATLNTDTRLQVDFDRAGRNIVLHRGEAYFSVVADAKRPFEVQAEDSVVRAVGTEFNVAIRRASLSVAVVEGTVEVEAENERSRTSRLIAEIKHGQSIRYRKGDFTPAVEPADLERIAAWRARKIYFQDDRLADAVDEYNRYTDIKIRLVGEGLEDQLITGIFNIGDIESFIFTLEKAFDVQVVKKQSRILVMQKGAALES